ncbi:MAG TPA: hypothetical protein VMJ10_24330 [Kofleriaceae bacterium]|nr:hypothetical protein [Kofleriaceae bacterium]
MKLRWLAIAAVLACGNKDAPSGDKPAPATTPPVAKPQPPTPPPPPPPAPPASAKLDSRPFELPCGDGPLEQPPPKPAAKPAAERTLKRADAIAECHDQASVDAVCACLAKTKKSSCHALPQGTAEAVVVDVANAPAGDSVSSGNALVVVAKHGATWSPVSEVESAADVDLTVMPHAYAQAKLARLDVRSTAAGMQIWIESWNERQEKSVGDFDHDGEEHGTLCMAPAGGAPFCYATLPLGSWFYSFDEQKRTCEIQNLTMFSATIDPPTVTLRLVQGTDKDGLAGSYKLTSP